MRKNCYDPLCPANRQLASTSKSPKSKTKKRKVACHRACPTTSRTSTKPRRKRSKHARSKKRSKERVKTLKIKFCKNKKCQASRSNVESSTSIHPSEKICVRSKDSVRLCRSRLPCQDSRPGKRTACNCQSRENVTIQKKKEKKPCRFKKCKQRTKQVIPLCICVRTSSTESIRRNNHPPCPILLKYGECCCIRHRRKRSERREPLIPRDSENRKPSCHCKPASTLNSRPNRPRVRRSCPVERCCSRSVLKRRNYSSPERRKVKFCK